MSTITEKEKKIEYNDFPFPIFDQQINAKAFTYFSHNKTEASAKKYFGATLSLYALW